jgi:hypothetical protein
MAGMVISGVAEKAPMLSQPRALANAIADAAR